MSIVAIVYHSGYGHTQKQAEAVAQGAKVGGAPAFEVKSWGRATAAYSRLPEMVKEMRRLRKEVERLSAIIDSSQHVKDEQ